MSSRHTGLQAELLHAFLKSPTANSVPVETLLTVGDRHCRIHWPSSHNQVVRRYYVKSEKDKPQSLHHGNMIIPAWYIAEHIL